ncbi:MAG: baseplate J/gp47 family protein [Balneolaceae bacterium]|nr:baseplate J/gp47 family protein [Balneolaceae bacterium]
MSDNCQHKNPLKHQGSSQGDRLLSALLPENVELHGLTEEDWLKFAYDYAQLVNYYPSDDPTSTKGDWQTFFESSDDVSSLINRYGEGDVEPHMALFMSFLKLLSYPQESLNEIPKRHLDFYYNEVLQLEKKPFQPDQVHVLFELAKNAKDELVDIDVLLKAGKDSEGNPLQYKTLNSLVVNQGKVASLKSVFVDKEDEGTEILRYAPMANSKGGIEEELDDGESWLAFGNGKWPRADLGFYISSKLLLMAEGRRFINLKFNLSELPGIQDANYKAFVTTEKKWLSVPVVDIETSNSEFDMILKIEIPSDLDPIVSYDEEVHAEGLPVKEPVLKILFEKKAGEELTEPVDYNFVKDRTIEKLELEVQAELTESLQLQNELGNVDPSKPFMPFGSRPKVGSKLEILSPEMYNKPISKFDLNMQWLNTPASFSQHYEHYQDAIQKQKALYSDYSDMIASYTYVWLLPQFVIMNGSSGTGGGDEVPPDTMKDDFKVKIESPYNPDPSGDDPYRGQLFSEPPQVEINISENPVKVSNGEIDMILTESFYHDLYSEIYVNAVLKAQNSDSSSGGGNGNGNGNGSEAPSVDLPNEPYTPLLDKLTLTYTAKESVVFGHQEESESSAIMFHRHPFGIKKVDKNEQTLVPTYKNNELYIGLENQSAGSNISLLFQVAEGSENPAHSTFEEGDIDWWELSQNRWQEVKPSDFARNQTNNFLRSGIAELPISKSATKENTLLDTGLYWLRVRLKKEEDAVSRFINVHAQASEAIFYDQENSTDHLDDGLPSKTIGQLVNPRAQIKSVAQPYASFGGKPEESDDSYYRRVSERLRHKERAVSIWDYEHLVLQEFPSLYKVKCLNHTRLDETCLNEMSPGDVTLVLIPKITEGNTEHRLKPKVSQDFKDQVEEYVRQKNSMHASIKAADAIYELVRFEFKIQFHTGLDFNYYQNQTREDLKRLLAPWVFDLDAAIEFGGSFSEYQVVNYLENLEYVDYISDFALFHQPFGGDFTRKTMVEPSNSMAILVPSENHDITQAEKCE